MATASKKAKLSSLEEHLLCPVCLTMPRSSPVPACDRGHIVCQECYDKLKVTYDDYPALKKCPTCREPMREEVFSIAGCVLSTVQGVCLSLYSYIFILLYCHTFIRYTVSLLCCYIVIGYTVLCAAHVDSSEETTKEC